MSVRDPSSGEVVGAELDLHSIARQDADVVLAHLPGDRGEHVRVEVVDVHPEHRARERFDDLAFNLDLLFLGRQKSLQCIGVSDVNTRTAEPCAKAIIVAKRLFQLSALAGLPR